MFFIVILKSNIVSIVFLLVELSPSDHKFEGLNQAAVGIGCKWHKACLIGTPAGINPTNFPSTRLTKVM